MLHIDPVFTRTACSDLPKSLVPYRRNIVNLMGNFTGVMPIYLENTHQAMQARLDKWAG